MVVLAGGTARRLGGVSKPDLVVAGRRLLDWTLAAVRAVAPGADVITVAPHEVEIPDGARRTLEDPPFGGPLAGLAAGLGLTDRALVLVASCDAPLAPLLLPTLRLALDSADGLEAAIPLALGRANFLNGLYRSGGLRALLDDVTARDAPVGRTLAALRYETVLDIRSLCHDVDAPEDAETLAPRLRARLLGRREPDEGLYN